MKQAIESGLHRVIIFHPESLLQDTSHVGVVQNLVSFAKEQDVWIAPPNEVSQFISNGLLGQAA